MSHEEKVERAWEVWSKVGNELDLLTNVHERLYVLLKNLCEEWGAEEFDKHDEQIIAELRESLTNLGKLVDCVTE